MGLKLFCNRAYQNLYFMFRFADKLDIFLIVVGCFASIVTGLAFPAMLWIYGELATGFIYYSMLHDRINRVDNSTSLPFDPNDYDDIYDQAKHSALYFCLLGVGAMVFWYIQYICWDISQERQMKVLRETFFRSIIHHDVTWYDLHHKTDLATNSRESMDAISAAIGKEVSVFIHWTSMWVGAHIVALIKGWKIALACMAFTPFIIIIAAVTMPKIKNVSIKETKAYDIAGGIVEEVLSNIKTVMAFNAQEKESQRYDRVLKEGANYAVGKGFAMGNMIGIIWLIIYMILSTAFAYGTKLYRDGEPGLEPGNVLIIFVCVMVGAGSLGQAFPHLETIGNGKAAAVKIFQIIDYRPGIDSSSEHGRKPEAVNGAFELRNVSFSYPSRPSVKVLREFSISVEPGETLALVGKSGSGKTTVVQLLERFYDVDIGEVMVDGMNVKGLNVSWLRKQIGYVSQETVLFGSSIKENIQHGNGNTSDEQITDAARKANIHDFISSLPEGYSTLVGDRGTQLSGGQKQRIAIARALVRDPKILLLDEATSSLDNENEAIVQKAIEKAKEGRTTVIVAHRLSTIQHADRIFVLEDGRVIEKGTHNELMDKNGLYHKLVKHQVECGSKDEVVQEIGETLFDSEEENKSPLFYRTLAKPIKLGSAVHVGSKQSLVKEETDEILTHFSIKRLLKLNSPEWHLIAIGCLFSICAGVLQPVLAVVLSEFLNVFTKPVDEQERMTWILVGVILGTGFVVSLMRICLAACFSKAGHHLTLRMRSLVFKSFLNQDMTFFDDSKNCVNILATRLATDAATVHGASGSKIGHTLESVSVLLSALVVAFTASWKLTLVIVSFLPLMIGMGIVVGKMFVGFSKKESAKMEQAGQICSEVIDNIRTVASLTQESSFKNKYGELTGNIYRKAIRRIVLTSLFLALSSSVVYFTLASTFTFGAYLVQHNGLRFHLVFRVFAAISYGGIHIGRTNSIAPDFTKAKFAAARLFSYIDTKPKIDVSATGGSLIEKFDGSIEFQSVMFHYPSRPGVTVLEDMSFTVSQGETLALIGSSGCGKTTTISLIERFYDPVTGRVLTDGEDTKLVNLKWLRSQIGLVDQEPALFDRCISENIAYGDNTRDVPMEEIIEAARNANIHHFISSLPQGYDTIVGSKGTQLSGGQKQRIAIARALVASPKILLMDEATSSLDSQNEKIVQKALSHVMKDKTCIVIAHRLSTIRKADKIAIIHKGEIVEQGTHSELLAKQGIYHKLKFFTDPLNFRVFAAISYGGIHIGRTNSIAPDFTKAKFAAARLFSYIDTKPKIDVSATGGSLIEKFDGSIEFQSVMFHYPSRPGVTVLEDMSFTVSQGETLALIGSSGCGKTTTISLIERFYDPVTGRVLTDGEDTKLVNLKWLRSQIGLVDQEPALFDRCISENIAYGDNTRDVPMEEIIEAARNANIHHFISSLPQGYDTIVGSKGTQLSGGQKQRIAIARALVASPKILLMDEATSSLDSQNEKIVQKALSHVMKDKTCIVIAHRLSTIRKADKIAIIHKGEIVEQGTHSELLAKQGIYHKLVHQHEH